MDRSVPASADATQKRDSGAPVAAIPCVIYAARSQAEDDGKDSTGDQVAVVRRRVEREQGRLVYGEPHVDHASGYRGNRGPGLERAIRAAEHAVREHGHAELWVWITSRLGRGTGYAGQARAIGHLLYELRARSITVRSVEDDEFATNEMLWGFASRMASKYSEDLAANVKRGIASNVRLGKPWGEPAYGYQKGEAGHWRPEPVERTIVERIYRERVEHARPFSAIARALNADRVPTRRDAKWSATVVRRILSERAVLGYFHHGGEWLRGEHEPLVSEDTWLAAQAIAERGKKYAPRGSGRVPKRHLFVQGMLRCGYCGEAMLPRTDGSRETYVCRTRKQLGGASACPMPVLRRVVVDVPAVNLFTLSAFDEEATRGRFTAKADERVAEIRAQAERADREAGELRAQRDRVERDYLAGRLSAVSYERFAERLDGELAAAGAECDRLTEHAHSIVEAVDALDADLAFYQRIIDLYSAVAGRVGTGAEQAARMADLGPLRAAVAAVFERVTVQLAPGLGGPPMTGLEHFEPVPAEPRDALFGGSRWDTAGDLCLVPTLRAEMVENIEEWQNGRHMAELRKVALELDHENSTSSGVPL